MKTNDCQYHGQHKYRLEVLEKCQGCGVVRRRSVTSRIALWLHTIGLWLLVLLFLGLLIK